MSRVRTIALAGLVAAGFAHSAAAVTIWDEGLNGDLSGDQAAPTDLTVGLGTNSITGTSQNLDRDFFTITVPDGARFTQLLLTSFDSTDDLAFFAIQSGPEITGDLFTADDLLGWLHPSATFVGTDILDDVALGVGAIGFTTPLGPGTYTLWLQQGDPELVTYGFDVIIEPVAVPEPSMLMLFVLGLGALAVTRRRRT